MRQLTILSFLLVLVACHRYEPLRPVADTGSAPWKTRVLPAEPQQLDGDPAAGLDFLLHGDYLGSGVPLRIMEKQAGSMPQDSLYPRNALNRNMPYFMTAFVAENGARIVNGNCFTCHAGKVNGELVPGLGNSWSEYERSMVPASKVMRLGMALQYKRDDPYTEAFTDFGKYFRVMAPRIETNQPGANPAFRLAEACMMHRDPQSLEYTDEPQFAMWDYNIATDTPPLWHVGKKNTLYYTGTGRGDFAKLLMQASVLGVPDSSRARSSVAHFADVYAWLRELEAPPYPGPVDEELAAAGEDIFLVNCAGCHGTYDDAAGHTYPNKIVSLATVGTDRLYADYIARSGIVDWYNRSWFATSPPRSRFEPTSGYVAPPLDGVWATAPYLHNGSVPTLYELLKSDERPERWTRLGYSRDYDWKKLGWHYDPAPRNRKWTFDTTKPGYGNGGHTFGDRLSEEERTALLEYLRTL